MKYMLMIYRDEAAFAPGQTSGAHSGAYVAYAVTPRQIQTSVLDENAGMGTSLAQASAVTSLGDLPLIVLSRGLDPDPDWQSMQAEFLQLSTNSRQIGRAHV